MSSPLLHFYDMKSGEFQSSRVAQKRPNGQFILDVQGATDVAPPELSEGQAACWDGHGNSSRSLCDAAQGAAPANGLARGAFNSSK